MTERYELIQATDDEPAMLKIIIPEPDRERKYTAEAMDKEIERLEKDVTLIKARKAKLQDLLK